LRGKEDNSAVNSGIKHQVACYYCCST